MLSQVKDSFLALKNSLSIRNKNKVIIDFIAFNHRVQTMIDSCVSEDQVLVALRFGWNFLFKQSVSSNNWTHETAGTHYQLLEFYANKKLQQLQKH